MSVIPQSRRVAGGFKGKESTEGIDDFRRDPRYAGDGNRIDLAYAVHALSHGASEDDVHSAIASRDLSKKGTPERQADYIERTIRKAMEAIWCEERAR